MNLRISIVILSMSLTKLAHAEPTEKLERRWSLELPLAFPEGLGAEVQSMISPQFSLLLFYHRPTPIRVKAMISSRKLVEREGILIRSPDIDLPFHVQLGPHHGMGVSYRPFGSAFYLKFAWESRLVTIHSRVQSHLEIIDSQSRSYTHTQFQAEADTRTEQSLWRPSFGYRWDAGETDYFFSLYSGWSHPYRAHSSVRTSLRVRNPGATRPEDVDAQNLNEAEARQEQIIQLKLIGELQKFEGLGLPILGISFGKFL